MKEPYGEGLASHTGFESCVWFSRKAAREGLTEAQAGRVLSFVRVYWSADAVTTSGRPHGRGRQRENPDGSTESENPGMHGNSVDGNQEIPGAPAALRK